MIQTNNQCKSQEIFQVSRGSQKEKKASPHHLSVTYQVYTKGGAMGWLNACG